AQSVPLDPAAVEGLLDAIEARAARVTHDPVAATGVRHEARHRAEWWDERRRTLPSGILGYRDAPDITGLLHDPGAGEWDTWTAPMSLREVEPEVLLQLAAADHSLDDAPPWHYDDPDREPS
ncbi:MAG: hypothetical protein M3011_09875, partial [Actinomycetota bacterium]|nr:hypothetical protein [Actinomycetota bacterium]